MSAPANLPMASLRYVAALRGGETRCQVLVAGEPVAELPAAGLEMTHDIHGVLRCKIGMLAESFDMSTHFPTRSA